MPGRFDVLREPEREPERGPSRGRGRDRDRSPGSQGPGEPTLSEVMARLDVLMAHCPDLATKNDISSMGAHFEAEFKGVKQDIKQLQSDRDDVRNRLAWAETQNAALRAQLQQANDRDSWDDTYRADRRQGAQRYDATGRSEGPDQRLPDAHLSAGHAPWAAGSVRPGLLVPRGR
jgi:hypothetical protein